MREVWARLIGRRVIDRTASYSAKELDSLPSLHSRDGWDAVLLVHQIGRSEAVVFRRQDRMVRVYETHRDIHEVEGWRLIEEYWAGP